MTSQQPEIVYIFTDGACRGNPGPGGWGIIMRYKKVIKKLKGADPNTTNNRMELQAVISALQALKKADLQVEITTDSKYVQKGITEWIKKWKKNNWRHRTIKNQDLWRKLDELAASHNITWHWVAGHSGHPENEMADALANQAIDELLLKKG